MARRDRLSDAAITEALATLPGWTREGDQVTRAFEFKDFSEAFGFLARVALLQERADHHAEVSSVYNRVRLTLSTHDAGGITAVDIDLAREIDGVSG
ncbi:MAG: 4a-hydroxytetrahydrobiopterin dehydratase [Chloroflexi bacterium]|nr:4a-hydroxytetrahydrobiopterin dehydratase [Chloroflexota bacterium]MDA1240306.1 4a-hydroxytetrahydrobiopterin dehydratase [Chloroflexota bacterium]